MTFIYIIVALFICSLIWVFGFKKLIVSLVAYSLTIYLYEYFANSFFDKSITDIFVIIKESGPHWSRHPAPDLLALAILVLPIYLTYVLINKLFKNKE